MCGHAFRTHVPKEILPRYYDRQYWNNDKNRQGIKSVKPSEEWKRWVAARLKILEGFHLIGDGGSLGKGSRILEFGCAEGMLLYALKQRGYDVMGNDVCAITDESKETLDIPISNMPIELFSKENEGKYDLIMSFHVVEHLRDPRMVFENLCTMLKEGGHMLLHVPVDDKELGNYDHFHFFTNVSCLKLMEQFTTDIKSNFVYYPIRENGVPMAGRAMAATYVGIKK